MEGALRTADTGKGAIMERTGRPPSEGAKDDDRGAEAGQDQDDRDAEIEQGPVEPES